MSDRRWPMRTEIQGLPSSTRATMTIWSADATPKWHDCPVRSQAGASRATRPHANLSWRSSSCRVRIIIAQYVASPELEISRYP